MTESEAIKELKEDIALYDNEITRLDASIGTPDRNLIDALEMAIQALEKQIPMKPKINRIDSETIYCKCPSCNITTVLYRNCIMKYCKECGQKLRLECRK